MRAVLFFCIPLLSLLLSLPATAAQNDASQARLLKVVALSHSGVSAPTESPRSLTLWSNRQWPQWPVERGRLSPRGARLLTAMWHGVRPVLQEEGLLPQDSCLPEGSIFVRSDALPRTQASAVAILRGLSPQCPHSYAALDAEPDALFHPVQAGLYAFAPATAARAVMSFNKGGFYHLQSQYTDSMALIDSFNTPSESLCSFFNLPSDCQISDLPNGVGIAPEGQGVRIVGGLNIASRLTGIFLQEYAQWPEGAGPVTQVDWERLQKLLPLHATLFNLVHRTPLVSQKYSGALLRELSAALLNRHYDARANEARLVVFVGDRTHLAHVAAMLELNWQLADYPPNMIPPGSVLLLELWQVHNRKEIRARFLAQTAQTLHTPFADEPGPAGAPSATAAAPQPAEQEQLPSQPDNSHAPAMTQATLGGAASMTLPLERFQQLVLQATQNAPRPGEIIAPLRTGQKKAEE